MEFLRSRLSGSPVLPRFVPLLVVFVLTALQGMFGESSRYWLYLLKTAAGLVFLIAIWPLVPEMRWKFSWPAAGAGVLVYLLWTQLDPFYPKLGHPGPGWNPHREFGPVLANFFIFVRLAGSALVIPPLEETFYRSFLYRYIARKDFLSIPLDKFMPGPFLAAAALFGFAHHEWLAGVLCGMIYHALVFRRHQLGEAMTAHAITNGLLGLHVVWRGAWHFW